MRVYRLFGRAEVVHPRRHALGRVGKYLAARRLVLAAGGGITLESQLLAIPQIHQTRNHHPVNTYAKTAKRALGVAAPHAVQQVAAVVGEVGVGGAYIAN